MKKNHSNLCLLLKQQTTIKKDVDTLATTKVIYNARLTNGSNNYLTRSDYSGGNAIDFS